MAIRIQRGQVTDILKIRQLYLQEHNCQIRYNACHERGWTDTYLFLDDSQLVGYASIKGLDQLGDRDTLFECYFLPAYREKSRDWIIQLIQMAKVQYLESQSNDLWTTSLLYEFGKAIQSKVILFQDDKTTNWEIPAAIVRAKQMGEEVYGKPESDQGTYVLEVAGEIRADGGFLLHYNEPFADLYMETASKYRNQGYATYILQEIKKECYFAGRIPAARCNIDNLASKAALLKAGMKIVGNMLQAKINPSRL